MGESGRLLREIYDSPGAVAGWLAFWLLMLLISVAVLVAGPAQNASYFILAGAAFAAVLSLLCLSSFVRRALTTAAPVVVIDEAGLLDRRVSAQVVRWTEIMSIRPIQYKGTTRGVFLELPMPLVTPATFAFAPIRRVAALIKRYLGAKSAILAVNALGTEVNGAQLYQWCLAYARTHRFELEKQNV